MIRVLVVDDDFMVARLHSSVVARQPGFEWRDKGDALTRLVGTPRLFQDLRAGKPVEEILAADAADHAVWRRDRQAALLYP